MRAGDALWAGWRGVVLQVHEARRSSNLLVHGIVQPLVVISLGLYARGNADPAYVGQVIAGATALSLWTVVLWNSGTLLLRDRMAGALATIMVRPYPLVAVLLGRTLLVALTTIVSNILVVLLIVNVRSGPPPALPGSVTMLALAALAAGSAACLGVLLSAVVVASRGAAMVIDTFIYVIFVLGGLLIPVNLLPAWARWPAELVSLHHVAVMVVDRRIEITPLLAVLALSAAYLGAGMVLMGAAMRRARREGTLDLV
ncbi:ABC transporter permease [Asanoa sp. NPDC049573]|uniref:ABC transporter permease n=1 Tax=Asanoa sp. NPDC049573 TaxID=3155396 RepID=UPI0034425704